MKRYRMRIINEAPDIEIISYYETEKGLWAKMADVRQLRHELLEWLYNTSLTLEEDRKFREILNKI